MGRLILLLLLIAAAVLVWKAFGPGTWKKQDAAPAPQAIKGPDDDEEFLWRLERDRFKERRAKEEAARQEEERIKRAKQRYEKPAEDDGDVVKNDDDDKE